MLRRDSVINVLTFNPIELSIALNVRDVFLNTIIIVFGLEVV